MGSRELFKQKMKLEHKIYCRRILMGDKESIMKQAGKIHTRKVLLDVCLEQCEGWTEEELQVLLVFPGFLDYLYWKWSRSENAMHAEMVRCIRKEGGRLVSAYREASEAA